MKLKLFLGSCQSEIKSLTICDAWTEDNKELWKGSISEAHQVLVENDWINKFVMFWSFDDNNLIVSIDLTT